ncbi:MAG: hypothetical protein JFAIHJKO_01784 [Pyrinomonadaceae bacterium]|nr:hypothetical protein [Pyrinomonadaceae bacterium]
MNNEVREYDAGLTTGDQEICGRLAAAIDWALPLKG